MDLDPFAAKSFKLQSFSLSIRSRPGSIFGKMNPTVSRLLLLLLTLLSLALTDMERDVTTGASAKGARKYDAGPAAGISVRFRSLQPPREYLIACSLHCDLELLKKITG